MKSVGAVGALPPTSDNARDVVGSARIIELRDPSHSDDKVEILHRGGGWVVRVSERGEVAETRFSLKAAATHFASGENDRLRIS